jgi:hypothetical protein
MSNYLQIKFASSVTINETIGKNSTGKVKILKFKYII